MDNPKRIQALSSCHNDKVVFFLVAEDVDIVVLFSVITITVMVTPFRFIVGLGRERGVLLIFGDCVVVQLETLDEVGDGKFSPWFCRKLAIAHIVNIVLERRKLVGCQRPTKGTGLPGIGCDTSVGLFKLPQWLREGKWVVRHDRKAQE